MSCKDVVAPGAPFVVAVRTDIGMLRAQNEDSVAAFEVNDGPVMVVCDGMGGVAGGALASQTAVCVIERALRVAPKPATRDDLARQVLESVREAHDEIRVLGHERRLDGMGTTATIAALKGDELVLAQVGDSRAYVLRQGCLTQITRDQSLAWLLVERGQLTKEEARKCEFGNVILQAVGANEGIEVDLTTVRLRRGDILLLSSDGLHGFVEDAVIAATLAKADDVEGACAELILHALEQGGPDNVTCVVARAEGLGFELPYVDETPTPIKVCLTPLPLPEPAPASSDAPTEPDRPTSGAGRSSPRASRTETSHSPRSVSLLARALAIFMPSRQSPK